MIESKPLKTIHETQCASGQQPACNIQPDTHGVESLNSNCFCISLDADALKRELEMDAETRNLYPLILEKCPHLFAAMPVFVSRHHLDRMAAIVQAAQTVIALPAFRKIVLEWAPDIAHYDASGAQGVFLSYDFHLTGADPQLIEIIPMQAAHF